MSVKDFGDWPGRIVSGAGAVAELSSALERFGVSRALVLCGTTVAGGPILEKVRAGLGQRCAGVFPHVRAHTPVEMVETAVAAFRETGADSLVTVGGGSAIDAGKAVSIVLATEGALAEYAIRYSPGGAMERTALPGSPPVHLAVPTTAGSASDVMPTAGVRDPISRKKLLFWDRKLVPAATILDPEVAVHTGAELTAATGMTAVARCVEALYSANRQPVSTGLALHALRLLHTALPRSVEAPADLQARSLCQMACAMSGMAAINAMVSLVHAIGHVVGGRYGLQHGISHAILLAPAMRLLMPTLGEGQALVVDALACGDRLAQVRSPAERAAAAIEALIARLPLPKRLGEVGVTEADLPDIARQTMSDYMMANLPCPLQERDVLRVLAEGL